MPETKPIEPAYRRHNYLEMPIPTPRPSGNGEKWTKFGIEQEVQDFINAGIEQTSIMKHVEDAGGLEHLKAAGTKSIDDEVIDRGMDLVTLNRFTKIINIQAKKLEEKRIAEEKDKPNKDEGE